MLKLIKIIVLIMVYILATGSLWAQDTLNLPKPPAVEVVRAKIGTGPDDFCISGSMGPMSFVISKSGEFYVLDQERSRIQVFKDNKRTKTIPLEVPGTYGMDIDLLPDNRIVLLDKLVSNTVFIIDQKGKMIREFKLAGGGVSDPATVDGVYVVNNDSSLDGIWVDNNRTSVRLADLKGNPDPDRPLVWGRFTYIHNYQMIVAMAGDFTAQVDTSDLAMSESAYAEYPLTFDTFLKSILGLDADKDGNIYLVTMHWEEGKGKIINEKNIVTVLNRGGSIEKRFEIFFPRHSAMIYRAFRVSPADGKVYFMAFDDKGLCIRMYDPWKK